MNNSHLVDLVIFFCIFSLGKEKVISNRRETFVLIISLHECLKFMCKSSEQELWNDLVHYQVRIGFDFYSTMFHEIHFLGCTIIGEFLF